MMAAIAPVPGGTASCIDRPAHADEAHGVLQRESAGGDERGVLAERVAGRDLRVDRGGHLLANGREDGAARRHEGGLGVGREGQRLFGALEDQARERPPPSHAPARAASARSKTARAAGDASSTSLAMPTLCDP